MDEVRIRKQPSQPELAVKHNRVCRKKLCHSRIGHSNSRVSARGYVPIGDITPSPLRLLTTTTLGREGTFLSGQRLVGSS